MGGILVSLGLALMAVSFFSIFILIAQISILGYKMNAIRDNRDYEGWFTERWGHVRDYSELPFIIFIKSMFENDPFCENEAYRKLYKTMQIKCALVLVCFFMLLTLIVLIKGN